MPLIFTKEKVELANDPLLNVFRKIFYRLGMTHERFFDLFATYADKMGLDRTRMITNRHNVYRQFQREDVGVTWTFVNRVLLGVLDMDIVYITFGIRKKNGKIIEISSRDPADPPDKTEWESFW